MKEEELVNYFQGLNIPKKLLALLKFNNEIAQKEYFSDGFEFSLDKEKIGLKTYSTDESFLNSIYEFANADGTGSSYGLWLKDDSSNLEESPIVVFGSEGGFHVVAKNFDELLQLLTFDSEPMVDWDEVSFCKDLDDFEPSSKSNEYRYWLKKEFSIDPIISPDPIIENAQNEHKDSFNNWVGKFYED